jgi:hypothetical protein
MHSLRYQLVAGLTCVTSVFCICVHLYLCVFVFASCLPVEPRVSSSTYRPLEHPVLRARQPRGRRRRRQELRLGQGDVHQHQLPGVHRRLSRPRAVPRPLKHRVLCGGMLRAMNTSTARLRCPGDIYGLVRSIRVMSFYKYARVLLSLCACKRWKFCSSFCLRLRWLS